MDRSSNERLASICRGSWRPWRSGATWAADCGWGGAGRNAVELADGTDASPDDLLPGGSRKVEEPFGRIDPDDVRPSADLPDRDPRNGLTDAWRVVAGRPSHDVRARRSAEVMANLRREAQRRDLYLVVNDPMTGEPSNPISWPF